MKPSCWNRCSGGPLPPDVMQATDFNKLKENRRSGAIPASIKVGCQTHSARFTLTSLLIQRRRRRNGKEGGPNRWWWVHPIRPSIHQSWKSGSGETTTAKPVFTNTRPSVKSQLRRNFPRQNGHVTRRYPVTLPQWSGHVPPEGCVHDVHDILCSHPSSPAFSAPVACLLTVNTHTHTPQDWIFPLRFFYVVFLVERKDWRLLTVGQYLRQ